MVFEVAVVVGLARGGLLLETFNGWDRIFTGSPKAFSTAFSEGKLMKAKFFADTTVTESTRPQKLKVFFNSFSVVPSGRPDTKIDVFKFSSSEVTVVAAELSDCDFDWEVDKEEEDEVDEGKVLLFGNSALTPLMTDAEIAYELEATFPSLVGFFVTSRFLLTLLCSVPFKITAVPLDIFFALLVVGTPTVNFCCDFSVVGTIRSERCCVLELSGAIGSIKITEVAESDVGLIVTTPFDMEEDSNGFSIFVSSGLEFKLEVEDEENNAESCLRRSQWDVDV